MDYQIACACGRNVDITEGAAGANLPCLCGRTITVPTLEELRIAAGQPPHQPSPELVIEHLLAEGRLPGSQVCTACDANTDETVLVMVECERSWTSHASELNWRTLILWLFLPMLLILPVWIFHHALQGQREHLETGEETEHGTNKFYRLPLPLCYHCKHGLRGRRGLKKCLRRIPDYDRLLEKFPDAAVTLCKQG
jgi:hypothetical protein